MELLREFARSNSEQSFATLVRRHINLVYSVALRRLNNAHEAEEVTQVVFIILAKKAGSLRGRTILSGWLYQTAQLTSANFQRAAIRRQRREQEAYMQFTQESESHHSWQRLSPLLEEAMARLDLNEGDKIKGYLKNNIFFDMTHPASWGKEQVECAIKVCGADHVLFGSSFPVFYGWMSGGVEFMKTLNISDEERELICNGNARRLFNID